MEETHQEQEGLKKIGIYTKVKMQFDTVVHGFEAKTILSKLRSQCGFEDTSMLRDRDDNRTITFGLRTGEKAENNVPREGIVAGDILNEDLQQAVDFEKAVSQTGGKVLEVITI